LNIKTSIIDLESIQVPQVPTEDANLIEALANSIVELGGLLRPPVLRILGIDEYEVISGHMEFYAYLQARQFDHTLPDRLTALIVDKKQEAAVQKQLLTTISTATTPVQPMVTDGSALVAISNLDAKLERLFANQHQSIDALQDTLLAKLEQSLPQPLPILIAFDRVTEPVIALQISKHLAFLGDAKVKKILNLLQSAKKSGKDLTSIANVQAALTETRNGKQTKVIGDKKMLEILDRWHQ
jgi:hypothetical protein